VGLLGLNGHGKSSLFKILSGTLAADTTTPPFTFDRTKTFCKDNGSLNTFLVPQDPPLEENDTATIRDYFWRFHPELEKLEKDLIQVNEAIDKDQSDSKALNRQKMIMDEIDRLDGWNIQQQFESYLKFFSIYDLEAKVITLSGGEQKKILLSLGLSCPHDVVLWDEPTNHLDLETLDLLEDEMMSSSKTFLVISHDRYFLSKVTNKIFSIEKQKIHLFNGNYADYLAHIQEREEMRVQLLAKLKNSLKRETDWMRQGIKARGTRSKKRVEGYLDLKSEVEKIKSDARRKLELSLTSTQRKTKKLIELISMSFSYGKKPLFNDFSASVWKEDKIGILGPNGVGKSTLLQILTGELSPVSGQVKIAEGLKVSHFTQKREELQPEMTAYHFLGGGLEMLTLANGQTQHILSYFEKFLFNKTDIHRPLKFFSGGEKNRLQLAKHLLQQADLWIFDEPTNDLDLETLEILEKTLKDTSSAMLLISHDRAFLAQVTNKIWVINSSGLESFDGGYAQAEDYLASLRLEAELLEKENKGQESVTAIRPETPIKVPLTAQEMKEINSKVLQFEEMLSKIQDKVRTMEEAGDFSGEKTKVYGELVATVKSLEDKLLELYESLDNG